MSENIILKDADYADRYSAACNAVFHKIEKLFYDREEWLNDGHMHTSDESREIAMAVFNAVGIESDTPFEPTMEWLQSYQNYRDRTK